jgi:hypothetical protein
VPVEASAGDEGVVLRLEAGGSLEGTILDGSTGEGCAGRVTLAPCDSPDQRWWASDAREDGAFRVEGLPPGTYCLAARASGERVGVLRGVSVRAGSETAGLVIALAPGAALRLKYAGKDGYLQYRIVSDGVTVAGDGVPAGATSATAVPAGRLVVECRWPRAGSERDPALETREIDLGVGEDAELVFGGDG